MREIKFSSLQDPASWDADVVDGIACATNADAQKAAALFNELIDRAQRAETELASRPRTEFVAVGWWTGTSLEWEPSLKPVRGMLLFRPVSTYGTDAAGERLPTKESK